LLDLLFNIWYSFKGDLKVSSPEKHRKRGASYEYISKILDKHVEKAVRLKRADRSNPSCELH
jgi:hypothetical protein